MSSQASDNAIRIPVEIVIDQTTRQLQTLRTTAERETKATAAAIQTQMSQVEQATTRGVASINRQTNQLRETFRGTGQAVAGMQQGLILLGQRGSPAIGALTTALAGLLATGLNPVALAIGGTVGLISLMGKMEEQTSTATEAFDRQKTAAEGLASAIERLAEAERKRREALGGPSAEEQRLRELIAQNEATIAQFQAARSALPSIEGLSDNPANQRSEFSPDPVEALRKANADMLATIEKLRQTAAVEARTAAITGASRGFAEVGGLAAEIARLGRAGDSTLAIERARGQAIYDANLARREQFDFENRFDIDRLFELPPGQLYTPTPRGGGPTPSIWTMGGGTPAAGMGNALFGGAPDMQTFAESELAADLREGTRSALVGGITDALTDPSDWEGALQSFASALQRAVMGAIAESIVGNFGGSGLLGLASSIGTSAAVSAASGGGGGAGPGGAPPGFFDDVFVSGPTKRGGEQPIVVINVPDEATADAMLSKASGAGARAVVVKGTGGGVSRGSIPPRRRR